MNLYLLVREVGEAPDCCFTHSYENIGIFTSRELCEQHINKTLFEAEQSMKSSGGYSDWYLNYCLAERRRAYDIQEFELIGD